MSKINSQTQFRRFNFTLYEKLDIIHKHISDIFNEKTCPFKEFHFKFEPNNHTSQPGRYHAQGYAELKKQTRLGTYDQITK
jgi:hypothetical protein